MPKKDFGKLRPASNLTTSVVKLVSVIEVSMKWKLQFKILLKTQAHTLTRIDMY